MVLDASPGLWRCPAAESAVTPDAPWLITLDEVPSTNTWCLERWQALAHGAMVWTPKQTGGRGRGGKSWAAPAGVLTASCVLHLPTDPGPLALAAGLAVLHTAEDLAPGLRCGIKWPNDLVVGRRKLAGVLVERPTAQVAVVGVGLNLSASWEGDLAQQRTSLVEHGATATDPLTALTILRRYLLEAAGLVRAGGFSALLPSLRERDVLRGDLITIDDGGRLRQGTAGGIDPSGRLLVDDVPVISGSVVAWHPTAR